MMMFLDIVAVFKVAVSLCETEMKVVISLREMELGRGNGLGRKKTRYVQQRWLAALQLLTIRALFCGTAVRDAPIGESRVCDAPTRGSPSRGARWLLWDGDVEMHRSTKGQCMRYAEKCNAARQMPAKGEMQKKRICFKKRRDLLLQLRTRIAIAFAEA